MLELEITKLFQRFQGLFKDALDKTFFVFPINFTVSPFTGFSTLFHPL